MLLHRNRLTIPVLAITLVVGMGVGHSQTVEQEGEATVPTLGGPPPAEATAQAPPVQVSVSSDAVAPQPEAPGAEPLAPSRTAPVLPAATGTGTTKTPAATPASRPAATIGNSAATSAGGTKLAFPKPSPDQTLLGAIRKQVDIAKARGKLLEANLANRDLEHALGDDDGGGSGVPALIGIYGSGKAVVAEFLSGSAILRARPGDWVNGKWRLGRVLSNGVELRQRSGPSKTVLLGGSVSSVPQHGTSRAATHPVPAPLPAANGAGNESDAIHTSR